MLNLVGNDTTALLGAALDVTTLRQQAIARNIANANTPGFRRLTVDFDAQLERMGRQAGHGMPAPAPSARPRIVAADGAQPAGLSAAQSAAQSSAQSSDISLDFEVADLSETVLHHQALLKVLSREYALVGLAITEGKR